MHVHPHEGQPRRRPGQAPGGGPAMRRHGALHHREQARRRRNRPGKGTLPPCLHHFFPPGALNRRFDGVDGAAHIKAKCTAGPFSSGHTGVRRVRWCALCFAPENKKQGRWRRGGPGGDPPHTRSRLLASPLEADERTDNRTWGGRGSNRAHPPSALSKALGGGGGLGRPGQGRPAFVCGGPLPVTLTNAIAQKKAGRWEMPNKTTIGR